MKTEHAHTRAGMPATSFEAADSVIRPNEKQNAVLEAFKSNMPDPMHDEELIHHYHFLRSEFSDRFPQQSDSGIRSRRAELVSKGLLVNSGSRAKTRAGRSTIIWKLK